MLISIDCKSGFGSKAFALTAKEMPSGVEHGWCNTVEGMHHFYFFIYQISFWVGSAFQCLYTFPLFCIHNNDYVLLSQPFPLTARLRILSMQV